MSVIETISLRLTKGATPETFATANSRVEADYLPEQPGYNPGSRVTTVTDDRAIAAPASIGESIQPVMP